MMRGYDKPEAMTFILERIHAKDHPELADRLEDLISQAAMLAAIYDSAFEHGVDHARHAFQTLLDNMDLLDGEAG